MDPFSITAGVVGTAGVALHSARRVKDFVGGIQGAPRAISALSKDLTALADVLETLNTLVNHVHLSGGAAHTDFIPLLKPPLENCTTALDSIFLTIKPYTKPSGQPKKSKWRGFVWTFRETEVLTLQKTLMDYKMSLDIALAVANLTTSSNGFSDIRKSIRGMRRRLDEDRESLADSSFMGSGTAGSDHGYTLKRYLLETETVLGDSPPFGLATAEAERSPPAIWKPLPPQIMTSASHHQHPESPVTNISASSALLPSGNDSQGRRVNVPESQLRLLEERLASEADELASRVLGARLAQLEDEERATSKTEKAQRSGNKDQHENNKVSGDSLGARALEGKTYAGRSRRSKPGVSFGGRDFISGLDTDHADSDSDHGGNETVMEGAGNRSSSLPLGDEYPEHLSSSPSIDDEDIDFEFVYALHNFIATVKNQVSVVKGETMVLLDDSNSYWWLVRLVKDGTLGYMPAEYIETPAARLSRLNKHRNIDLAATMLGDVLGAKRSKPLKLSLSEEEV